MTNSSRPLTTIDLILMEEPVDLGKCICGQPIAATGSMDEADDDDIPAVMHKEPICTKFKELEPIDFLAYVRRIRASRTS